ncbi:MAG: amino-acid N-acetyltransferase [Lawsonella sp.]
MASTKPCPSTPSFEVRPATTDDVPGIKALIDIYAGKILLEKNLIDIYEALQEYVVVEKDGEIVGCGALHVFWSDLGELRTIAVHPSVQGIGVGHLIVTELLRNARFLGLERVFVLTFEVDFFTRYGFQEIEGTPVSYPIYQQMLRSYDAGVAEFLDLSSVKPNTLGNTRMLAYLAPLHKESDSADTQ